MLYREAQVVIVTELDRPSYDASGDRIALLAVCGHGRRLSLSGGQFTSCAGLAVHATTFAYPLQPQYVQGCHPKPQPTNM